MLPKRNSRADVKAFSTTYRSRLSAGRHPYIHPLVPHFLADGILVGCPSRPSRVAQRLST
ncbi:hypothetical protein KP509_06G055200 [Ceratopteris richardii]|uniref:Uncharacterized protein n=1 Tax=Ceratopteris richardii TaxID=49495 RepID=A0A8T2UKZ8_CERRI|nr:hypothetical protein KP509_06G055200 [Ceratopteris richardii]